MAGARSGSDINAPAFADDLEKVAANWLAAASNGLELITSNNTFFREESYEVTVSREGGLGLVLAEMWAEGDGSQRGLVLVEEIVAGSNSESAGGIAVGDTILGVSGAGGLAAGVMTEGRDWDTTIDALTSLDGAELTLVMKRLVARGRINVQVTASTGEDLGTFNCASGSNLRMEFLRRSLPKDEIYDSNTYRFDAIGNSGSNCGGEGSCGTCLVSITSGLELCDTPGRVEGKALEKQQRPARWRWSCRTALGDGTTSGDIAVQLKPQVAFVDEQKKTEGLGV